jgi:hypothetical protein
MRLYEDENGQRFAFEDDGSQDNLITENLTLVSQATLDSDALASAIEAKKQEVNTKRDAKNAVPILHQVDGVDKYFTIDILDWNTHALSMDDAETIDWICTDNSTVSINKSDILSLCNHIRVRRTNSFLTGRIQKDEIMALTTVADVEAYVVQ